MKKFIWCLMFISVLMFLTGVAIGVNGILKDVHDPEEKAYLWAGLIGVLTAGILTQVDARISALEGGGEHRRRAGDRVVEGVPPACSPTGDARPIADHVPGAGHRRDSVRARRSERTPPDISYMSRALHRDT